MNMECTYCGQAVNEKDLEEHAFKHFEETRGIDHQGNSIPSRIEVNFLPINR
jgi:predicted small metal-binding protein